jgi:Sulfotransferase family
MTGSLSGDADPLQALLGRHGSMWRTYAVPDARVMFVQVHKNACTSLKWMLAGVAGEDANGFTPSLHASTGDADDIHNRTLWRKSPRLDRMDPELRAQIHPSNGWFVFAVTRDPRSRLFSAWQSKLLLENPGYTSSRTRPWYPRHPVTEQSVIEDFARFVDLLEQQPEHRIRRDPHFCDQIDLLHEDVVTYTEIYDVRELGRLQADLRSHLDQVGWTGDVVLRRLNDTPLRPNAQPFVDGIRERVEKIYAADFERFGDRWDFSAIEAVAPWTGADLQDVDLLAGFGRRIGYLRDQALHLRASVAKQRQRADAQQARADALERRLRELEPTAQGRGQVRSKPGPRAGRVRRLVRRMRPGYGVKRP